MLHNRGSSLTHDIIRYRVISSDLRNHEGSYGSTINIARNMLDRGMNDHLQMPAALNIPIRDTTYIENEGTQPAGREGGEFSITTASRDPTTTSNSP
ncbi:hypothetical protein BHE74_00044473 [Ensete ventricosum]|nr:hypothetical protein BHE74_00044473 [Ensete ventricosum]